LFSQEGFPFALEYLAALKKKKSVQWCDLLERKTYQLYDGTVDHIHAAMNKLYEQNQIHI
jgi:hypothetical protein